jgi:inositol oxygenase
VIALELSIMNSTVGSFRTNSPPLILTNLHGIEKQTVAFNIKARVEFKSRKRARMGVWEAMEMLNTLVDESDPDVSGAIPQCRRHLTDELQTSVSQIEHLLQTAEAIRRDGKPEWMQVISLISTPTLFLSLTVATYQVTGLVHDLGKLLFMFGSEGQWDVVGVRTFHLPPMLSFNV